MKFYGLRIAASASGSSVRFYYKDFNFGLAGRRKARSLSHERFLIYKFALIFHPNAIGPGKVGNCLKPFMSNTQQ